MSKELHYVMPRTYKGVSIAKIAKQVGVDFAPNGFIAGVLNENNVPDKYKHGEFMPWDSRNYRFCELFFYEKYVDSKTGEIKSCAASKSFYFYDMSDHQLREFKRLLQEQFGADYRIAIRKFDDLNLYFNSLHIEVHEPESFYYYEYKDKLMDHEFE